MNLTLAEFNYNNQGNEANFDYKDGIKGSDYLVVSKIHWELVSQDLKTFCKVKQLLREYNGTDGGHATSHVTLRAILLLIGE